MSAGAPGRTLLEVLGERSAAAPASVAVRDDDRVLTYEQLSVPLRPRRARRGATARRGVGARRCARPDRRRCDRRDPGGHQGGQGRTPARRRRARGRGRAGAGPRGRAPRRDGRCRPGAVPGGEGTRARRARRCRPYARRARRPAGRRSRRPGGPVHDVGIDRDAEGLRHPARRPGPGRGLVDHAVRADARRPRRHVLPPQLRRIAGEHVRRAGEWCRAPGVRAPAGRRRSARGGDRCRRDHRRAHERVAAAHPPRPAPRGRELPGVAAARSGCGGHAPTRHRALPAPRRTHVHARLHVRHVGDRPGRARSSWTRRGRSATGRCPWGHPSRANGCGSSVRMRTASGRS